MQNIVILAGNIGQAPETRTTQGGTKTHDHVDGLLDAFVEGEDQRWLFGPGLASVQEIGGAHV